MGNGVCEMVARGKIPLYRNACFHLTKYVEAPIFFLFGIFQLTDLNLGSLFCYGDIEKPRGQLRGWVAKVTFFHKSIS